MTEAHPVTDHLRDAAWHAAMAEAALHRVGEARPLYSVDTARLQHQLRDVAAACRELQEQLR